MMHNPGKRYAHKYFSPEEFIEMRENGHIFTEEGYDMGTIHSEFMSIHRGAYWENDWKEY